MTKDQIYKMCKGLEMVDKKIAIKKLMTRGYSNKASNVFYSIWRKHYVTTKNNIS